jgi:ABC-2 type transport system permease protein
MKQHPAAGQQDDFVMRRIGIDPTIYDSASRGSAVLRELTELIRYRFLLWNLISRDLKVRYKRSFLGFLWAMINPLLTMIVLLLVFTNLFRFDVKNYPIYILSGLLIWNLFARGTSMAIRSMLDNNYIYKQIYVPASVFVASSIGSGFVNLLFAIFPLLILAWIMGVTPHFSWLFLPIPILLTALFSFGIGLIIAALAVFFTDILDIYEVGMNAYFYLTPVIYPISILQEPLSSIERLNPMYHYIDLFRVPLLEARLPAWDQIAISFLLAVIVTFVGWLLFTRLSTQFAYRT